MKWSVLSFMWASSPKQGWQTSETTTGTPLTHHANMRAQNGSPRAPSPMQVNAGPWESLQTAELHTQRLVCKSFWVLWKRLGLVSLCIVKGSLLRSNDFPDYHWVNSAATPEIESCPVLLTAWWALKTLGNPLGRRKKSPMQSSPWNTIEAHLPSEVAMLLATWGVPASPQNPAQSWEQPEKVAAFWVASSAGWSICSVGVQSRVREVMDTPGGGGAPQPCSQAAGRWSRLPHSSAHLLNDSWSRGAGLRGWLPCWLEQRYQAAGTVKAKMLQ